MSKPIGLPTPFEPLVDAQYKVKNAWYRFFSDINTKTNGFTAESFTVGTLPSVTPAGHIVYVTDEVGGATIAFSNGTNWLRVSDLAPVST